MRNQLVAEQRHILRLAVQPVDDTERLRGVLVDHTGSKLVEIALIGKSRRGTYDLGTDLAADCYAAVEQRQSVTHRAVGHRCDEHCGSVVEGDILMIGDIEQPVGDITRRNAVKIEPLAARLDRQHDLVNLGCREDKDHVARWLLEDLKQRVEGLRGEHMYLIDDVDLEAALVGSALNLVDDPAYVVDFAV